MGARRRRSLAAGQDPRIEEFSGRYAASLGVLHKSHSALAWPWGPLVKPSVTFWSVNGLGPVVNP